MRTCTVCLLPESFPGLSFDGAGVCNHCRQFEARRGRLAEDKRRYSARFAELLESLGAPEARAAREHDLLMAFSGGKDSTYTLALLVEKHRLRVLAVSFDNGFVSPAAVENIRRVTDRLGVDHLFVKPRWDLLRKVFATAAQKELYSRKTLERASTICTSCMGLVKAACLRLAIERGIPMIGYGWSPGQAPVQSSIVRTNPGLARMTQEAILGPMRDAAGDQVEGWFLRERHFAEAGRFPWLVHPLAWETYDEATILESIRRLGWMPPRDTDGNSTNCLLNAFANDVHERRYGFHPYVWEIANMVREGVMSREEGRRKFEQEVPPEWLAPVRERLGLA